MKLDSNGVANRAEFYRSVERHPGSASGASSILLQYFVPMPQVTETLDALRERGVKVGLFVSIEVIVGVRGGRLYRLFA